MKKSTLEQFVKKYNLNGNIQSVKLSIDSKLTQLKTHTMTEEKNVLVDVTYNKFDAITEDVTFGIYDTAKLKSMLGVVADEITLTLNKKDDVVKSLVISDGSTDAQFITADLSVIADVPNIKKLPEFNLEIELNSDFVSKFTKAKNSLPEVDSFTLMMNKKNQLELILGYSSINSNRIKLSVTTANGKNTVGKVSNYNAKYLKEILAANSDCDNAVLKVSDAGLAMVTFIANDFVSTYYMVELKSVD